MPKLTLTDLTNLENQSGVVTAINANMALIETAVENTLSRDGTSPNTMSANLDMNDNRILNLPAPLDDSEPVRLGDLDGTVIDAEAAAAAASISAAAASASAVAAAASASAASTSVTNAQTAETNAETAETNAELAETNAEAAAVAADASADIALAASTALFIYPEALGAIGDGVADDTIPLQNCFDDYVYTRLTPGATYKITEALVISSSNRHLDGRGATIYMPAASFTNITDTFLNSDASGIQILGMITAPYTQIENVSIRNLILESEVSDGRKVDGIVVQNVKDVDVSDNEIFGFPLAKGIRYNSCTGYRFSRNHIHTFTDDTNTWTGVIQMTGIEGDGDRTNSLYSTQGFITENNIFDLTVGAAFIAAFDYQTDGIQGGKETEAIITGNRTQNTGEGIDWWGNYSTISNNIVQDSYLFGIALKHGCSHTTVANNVITNVNVAHIYIAPGTDKAADGNIISGNICLNLLDSGGTRACVRLEIDDTTFKVTNTQVIGNTLRPSGNGDYAISVGGTGTGNVFLLNEENPGLSGVFSDTGGAVTAHIAAAAFLSEHQHVVPVCGNASVGATAGWVITGSNKASTTLPAGQTDSTLVIPITNLRVGDTLTAVSVQGQVESGGNGVTLSMDVRKLTAAASDLADASLGTDNVGTLVADTLINSSNLGVTGLTEVLAEGESVYVVLQGTTGAGCDIDLNSINVTALRTI